jgi:hypothetical protein
VNLCNREARWIAVNIARLPELVSKNGREAIVFAIPDAQHGFHTMSSYLPEGIRKPSEAGRA